MLNRELALVSDAREMDGDETISPDVNDDNGLAFRLRLSTQLARIERSQKLMDARLRNLESLDGITALLGRAVRTNR